MAVFLSTSVIRLAVNRLKLSSAQRRICDYLIGMRTLKLGKQEKMPIAESCPEFIQALEEFTMWTKEPTEATPYFNPFGSQADFRSRKFRSNGPSNTMHGWATQTDSPFEIHNDRPKQISIREVEVEQLQSFLLLKNGKPQRPRLIDVAIWFYRSTDLSKFQVSSVTREFLEERFCEDVGLDEATANALFRFEVEDNSDELLEDSKLEHLEQQISSSESGE